MMRILPRCCRDSIARLGGIYHEGQEIYCRFSACLQPLVYRHGHWQTLEDLSLEHRRKQAAASLSKTDAPRAGQARQTDKPR